MLATSLSIGVLSAQAHAAGLFGRAMLIFGLVVAVLLLAAVFFFPMAALPIWVIVAVVVLMRRSSAISPATAPAPLAGPA